jgi:hypothetical protein
MLSNSYIFFSYLPLLTSTSLEFNVCEYLLIFFLESLVELRLLNMKLLRASLSIAIAHVSNFNTQAPDF